MANQLLRLAAIPEKWSWRPGFEPRGLTVPNQTMFHPTAPISAVFNSKFLIRPLYPLQKWVNPWRNYHMKYYTPLQRDSTAALANCRSPNRRSTDFFRP